MIKQWLIPKKDILSYKCQWKQGKDRDFATNKSEGKEKEIRYLNTKLWQQRSDRVFLVRTI